MSSPLYYFLLPALLILARPLNRILSDLFSRGARLFFPDESATVEGTVTKEVQCEAEDCGAAYVYELSRSASQEKLRHILASSCDPVPCPACGWYPAHMVRRMKQLRYRWTTKAAIACFFAGAALAIAALILTAFESESPSPALFAFVVLARLAVAACLLGIPLLLFLKWWLNRGFDPNQEDVETRKALGRARAFKKADWSNKMALRPLSGSEEKRGRESHYGIKREDKRY